MNDPAFRPPAEANSLILQVDRGCPYNRCTFCRMYRAIPYERRSIGEVTDLVARQARRNGAARRIFLADGDVMRRPFAELDQILVLLNRMFPRLARVGVYANGSSILAKTDEELAILRALNLHTLYMGLESGDEEVLRLCRKGETAAGMVEAAIRAQSAGLRMSVMVLIGLGGTARSQEHARLSAVAVNRMQPRLLSTLRVIPVPGTELYNDVQSDRFQQLSEHRAVEELHEFIQDLEMDGTVFRANHSSNIVPLEGRLPRDKHRLLSELRGLLASGDLDRHSPGPAPLWL